LLESYPNNITLFAGDIGATNSSSPFMYHQFNNITLIGSGMGKGVEDNIVITEVYADSIYYNLIAINSGDPKSLGELNEFTLIGIDELMSKKIISVYPNPANRFFNIKNPSNDKVSLLLFDIYGRVVISEIVNANELKTIDVLSLKKGTYFIKAYNKNLSFSNKLIVN